MGCSAKGHWRKKSSDISVLPRSVDAREGGVKCSDIIVFVALHGIFKL